MTQIDGAATKSRTSTETGSTKSSGSADAQLPTIDHWIGGRIQKGKSGRSANVFNPATGKATHALSLADVSEVDAAVAAAKKAFPAWSRMGLTKRSTILFNFRELVNARKDDLARLVTREHGKVFSDAQGEVQRGLEVVEFACGIPHLIKGEFAESVATNVDSHSIRQPLGVVAGITPFNFPMMVPMWMYPIAIAAGNTFVLKPSEKDPSASMLCAELWKEAGLPDGVFNVVQGDKVAVDRILEHKDIAAVSFVGSTPIARYIYENGTKAGKRVQALGGAKNHMVVLPDADMELAADSAVNAAFGSAGQRCMAISVLVTVGDAADKLIPLVSEKMNAIHVGDGMEPGNDMGPLVTKESFERVTDLVKQGVASGAKLVNDGRKVSAPKGGFFLGPCLFDEVTPAMSIYSEEIFGPVLTVVRAKTYDEAVEMINKSPYANGVAIFTNDGGAARRFQSEIQVGMVGINVPIPVPMAYFSFGGWKDSLFGDAHVHGMEGVKFYTRGKVVTARWPAPELRGKNLGFPTVH
jgi:malonate-semialdehyde dehydrogenase (acetylating)/methylmalonate-semialdehyde dehydrogenase